MLKKVLLMIKRVAEYQYDELRRDERYCMEYRKWIVYETESQRLAVIGV